MIIKNQLRQHQYYHGGVTFNFLDSGDIYEISYQENLINLICGNGIDGSTMNLYLRLFDGTDYQFTKLIGNHSPSHFEMYDSYVRYSGVFNDVKYQVIFVLADFKWTFEVILSSDHPCQAEVFYGQDVAIQAKNGVLSNELYTVQYIDYKVFSSENGYTLCARQNQGRTQLLQIGSYTPNVAYTTDGFQFFGLTYKKTGIPIAMKEEKLISEIYQYEFAYFALQSAIVNVSQTSQHLIFYGLYQPDFHGIVTEPVQISDPYISPKLEKIPDSILKKQALLNTSKQMNGLILSEKDVKSYYSLMSQVEKNKEDILSFFTKNQHHVVTQKKELLVERPHGHLMIHGDLMHVSENVMATTNFMYGVFNSHVVLGNSSFNKFLGVVRNPLNLQKISGQRIYIKIKDTYYLLGLPSFYDIGVNTTRWVYVLEQDVITVESFVDMNKTSQILSVSSKNKIRYEFVVSQQVIMSINEYEYDFPMKIKHNEIIFTTPQESMMQRHYPNLKYRIKSGNPFEMMSEKDGFGCENQHGLVLLHFQSVNNIKICIDSTIDGMFGESTQLDYDQADIQGTKYFESLTRNIEIKHENYHEEVDKLSNIIFWYAHNAMVHYASPHGLEQYNGAAWGTRDICQGPIEFFSATQHYDLIREILLKVYSRQFIEDGDFPQWYMFDKYYKIQSHEAHGDIVIWPLRSIAYYLRDTQDLSILDEKVSFMSKNLNKFVDSETILEHIIKQIDTINASFIPDTYLPRYGGGDWDDTLQPANHELTNKMVSGWTVALLYEALNVFNEEIMNTYPKLSTMLSDLILNIKKDYNKHMVIDGIPAGFVIFNEPKTYILHPRDEKTGLHYRLLPMIRSMIGGLADQDQIDSYVKIINRNLKYPDGVRLMDIPVEYNGGKQTYFTRAETAANFGREISLQYVHAHIRYIEAMAKIGLADEAYNGLFTINPILIQSSVANAYYRQSNVYFSSSDAWFKNRYEAKSDFYKIKSQEVMVKGGWRLYSSGPGIYIKQLITNILGIKRYHGNILFDPVLPKHLDGLEVNYQIDDIKYKIHYHYGKSSRKFIEQIINNEKTKEEVSIDIWFE